MARINLITLVSGLSLCAMLNYTRAAEAWPFDQVSDSDAVFAVYDIKDLTIVIEDQPPDETQVPTPPVTSKQQAEQVDSLVRETIGVGGWTTTGGHGAAMTTTPQRMTVKAPASLQGQIAGLLDKLREQRRFTIKTTFRIVDSASLRPSTLSEAQRTAVHGDFAGPPNVFFPVVDAAALPADLNTVLSPSEVTCINGQRITWLDGTGLPLPTIITTATVSADRKYATMMLCLSDGPPGKTLIRTTHSIPFGETAAMPLDAKASRWLLFKPMLIDISPRPMAK